MGLRKYAGWLHKSEWNEWMDVRRTVTPTTNTFWYVIKIATLNRGQSDNRRRGK
jgi:hypothetical protein